MEQKQPAGIGPVERGVGRPVPERDLVERLLDSSGSHINGLYDREAAAELQVLRCQVSNLRDALLKVLEARDKEARATASYRVARDNFSAGGRMEAADRLLVLQQLASSAEKEARLLLATLKTPNVNSTAHPAV